MSIDSKTSVVVQSEKQTILFSQLYWLVVMGLVGVALVSRIWNLALPVARDYDEGVYWQSLRAMSEGHALYGDIFYSQPPFFLLSIYPFYLFCGQSILAARLGIMCMSMLGILAMAWLGFLLRGRTGLLIALLLITIQPTYLLLSQTLQAEVPALFLTILAIALGYQWWRNPTGWRGLLMATLAGVVTTLAILSKLFGIIALVPLSLIFLCSLRDWRQKSSVQRRDHLLAIPFLLAGCLLSAIFILAPFLANWEELVRGVITFHTDAEQLNDASNQNGEVLFKALFVLLTLLAIAATMLALYRRDLRLFPLLGWFFGTLFLLLRQNPLFNHHLVFLYPPLMAIGILAFPRSWQWRWHLRNPVLVISCIILITLSFQDALADYRYVRNPQATLQEKQDAFLVQQIARDLSMVTEPGDLVITDSQFLVALANRSTPASLVDTSNVRRESDYMPVEL